MPCCPQLSKCSAYKFLWYIDVLLALVAFMFLVAGVVFLAQDGDTFFSVEIYIGMIVISVITFGILFLGCLGARDPKSHPNYLFCYWVVISVLLIGNATAFHFFRVIVRGVERSGDSTTNQVLDVFETQVAQGVNDLIMSSYTACCTGCDDVLFPTNCEDNPIEIGQFTDDEFCAQVLETPPIESGDCQMALPCSAEQLAQDGDATGPSDGLGLGCYTSAIKLPSFPVRSDTCALLAGFTSEGEPIVGPASNGISCGGGEPKKYLEIVTDYLQGRFLAIAIPWGMMLFILATAWICSLFLILCPQRGGDEMKK